MKFQELLKQKRMASIQAQPAQGCGLHGVKADANAGSAGEEMLQRGLFSEPQIPCMV